MLPPETPQETISRLQRELVHVLDQSRVAHAMAQSWKARALAAEEQLRRFERKVERRQAKVDTKEVAAR